MTRFAKLVSILLISSVLFAGLLVSVPQTVNAADIDVRVYSYLDQLNTRRLPPNTIILGEPFIIGYTINVEFSGWAHLSAGYSACLGCSNIWTSGPGFEARSRDSAGVPVYVGIANPGSFVAWVSLSIPSAPTKRPMGFQAFQVVPSPYSSFSTSTAASTGAAAGSRTDWAVTSVSLSPSAPQVGDQVTFSMVLVALSSGGSFPQSVTVGCAVDGVVYDTGTFSYPGPIGVPVTVTSQTPWTATSGTHTLTGGVAAIPASLDPNPGNNLMSMQFTVAPRQTQQQFDFSISASPSQQSVAAGGSTSYVVIVNLLSGSAQSVALSLSGEPTGVSGSFNPTSGAPPFTSTLSVTATSSASPGTATVTVTGSGGGVTHPVTLTLVVSQGGDFRIDVSPSMQRVLQGQTTSYSVSIVGLNGFNSQISLSVSGLPSGANGVFSVPLGAPNFASTLTVMLPTDVSAESFTLTITGSGGGVTRTANVVLVVNPTQTQSQTTTTQTTYPVAGGFLERLQQNSLIIISALVVLVILFGVFVMRGLGRHAVPGQSAPLVSSASGVEQRTHICPDDSNLLSRISCA